MLFQDSERAFDRLHRPGIERCMSAVGFGSGQGWHAGTCAHRPFPSGVRSGPGQPSLTVATFAELGCGQPCPHAGCPAGQLVGRSPVCCTTARVDVSNGELDRRVWRMAACGRLQVKQLTSAGGALLPGPPATSAFKPLACL